MKSQFVKLYLRFVAIVLSLTALAKIPALVTSLRCMEEPLFGRFQPEGLTNNQILGTAAFIEISIVLLICFSPWRWLPCLASALWGSICLIARLYFIISGVDCRCLGWLAKPGPMTNTIAGLLALAITVGGFKALQMTRQNIKHAGLAHPTAIS
ncbi:MAG TPA: hypothetical protein VMA13_04610 [Candidatus Saccharimonadales bacterium]|nr:hypothetical protein [Candidatus Saccharimonadales bacterium]